MIAGSRLTLIRVIGFVKAPSEGRRYLRNPWLLKTDTWQNINLIFDTMLDTQQNINLNFDTML